MLAVFISRCMKGVSNSVCKYTIPRAISVPILILSFQSNNGDLFYTI